MTLKQVIKQTEKKFERIITAMAEGKYLYSDAHRSEKNCALCRFDGGGCLRCPISKITGETCWFNKPSKLYRKSLLGFGNNPDKSISNLLALYMWLPMLLEVE